jgi:hypothetical protein
MTSRSVGYKRHRFPPAIIAHAVWLYFRFPLSLRLVEEMLLERGIVVSYETVRRWAMKATLAKAARQASFDCRLDDLRRERAGNPGRFARTSERRGFEPVTSAARVATLVHGAAAS